MIDIGPASHLPCIAANGLDEAELDRLFPDRSIKRVLLINPPDADGDMFCYDVAKRGRYSNYPPRFCTITTNFALDGVRCNGVQRLNGLPRCLSELEKFIKELRRFQKKYGSILRAAEDALCAAERDIEKHLTLCPKCKGKQGRGRCGGRPPWEDCGHCAGRGYTIKKKGKR